MAMANKIDEPLTKLTVNLLPVAVNALEEAAGANDDTKTDTVNRALQVYALVTAYEQDGWALHTIRPRQGFWARLFGRVDCERVTFPRKTP